MNKKMVGQKDRGNEFCMVSFFCPNIFLPNSSISIAVQNLVSGATDRLGIQTNSRSAHDGRIVAYLFQKFCRARTGVLQGDKAIHRQALSLPK
jgi:hypothetical protein